MTDTPQQAYLSGIRVAKLSLLHWCMIVAAASVFGAGFFFVKLALTDLPPMTVAALRCSVAVPYAWLILKALGGAMPPMRDSWRFLFVLSLLTAVIPFIGVAYGQGHIETALGGMLFGSLPIFNVILVPLIARDEPFHGVRLFGALIGFGGLILVMAPKFDGALDTNVLAMLAMVLSAAAYAAGMAFARRNKTIHPIAMIVGQLMMGSVILLPLAFVIDAPQWILPSPIAWTGVFGVAILSTAVAPALLFLLIRMIGGTRVAIVPLTMPIFATLIGVFIAGETIHILSYAGLGCIVLGAIVIARSQQRDA